MAEVGGEDRRRHENVGHKLSDFRAVQLPWSTNGELERGAGCSLFGLRAPRGEDCATALPGQLDRLLLG
jgi:hypothetical protein